jgi:deazaflavin-dependent oxidoreductase (nitroreductase family)
MPPDAPTISRLTTTRTVDLVTIGRKSGRSTRVEIWWFYFEDRFIITGTPGPRDWYANILDNPRVVIETRHGNFPATASTVSDRMFRKRFFSDGAARWYSTQAELDELIETAPMIELDLD